MKNYRKIGTLFVAIGLTLTGQYLINTDSERVRADDVAAVMGGAVEREMVTCAGDQQYTNATVSGAVPSEKDSLHIRPFFDAACGSMRSLRHQIAEGGYFSPFEITRDTPYFSDGSTIVSNEFSADRQWLRFVPMQDGPRGIPDRLDSYGHPARHCALELIGQTGGECIPFGLEDAAGHRSRWQLLTGQTSDAFRHELGDSYSMRVLRSDLLACQKVLTNTFFLVFNPMPALAILPGSFYKSGYTARVRTRGTVQAARAAAMDTWADVERHDIVDIGDLPRSARAEITISQFMDEQDWTVYASQSRVFHLEARPTWPCRQAIESGHVGSVTVYLVYSLPWQYESFATPGRRINTAYMAGGQPALLGLPSLTCSPLPSFGFIDGPVYHCGRPRRYVAAKVMAQYNPRTWPLDSFTIDITGFTLPDLLPDGTRAPGQLSIDYAIHGLFTVAWYISDHIIGAR